MSSWGTDEALQYPSHEAADAAISEVRAFFDEGNAQSLERVVFCNFLEKDEVAYQKAIGSVHP
jgi:O-acetyl-ADP-ribose deacetylase (regulator of RNase III)